MELTIARGAQECIQAHAAAEHPREACGILLGRGNRIAEVRPCANVHAEPEHHFEIDPQALIDAHRAARGGGPEVIGYYHSHPHGLLRPSATDRAMAAGDGRIWIIAGGGHFTCWRDGAAGFSPLSCEIVVG